MKVRRKVLIITILILLICAVCPAPVSAVSPDMAEAVGGVTDEAAAEMTDETADEAPNEAAAEAAKETKNEAAKKKKLVRTNTGTLILYQGRLERDPFEMKISKSIRSEVSVSYSVKNKKIARFTKGKNLKGLKAGSTTITAKVEYKGETIAKVRRKVKVKKFKAGKKDPLKGKTIIGIGDSLMYGNRIGKKYTWLNLLGKDYDMKVYNYGRNGAPVAYAGKGAKAPLSDLARQVIKEVKHADYIIIQGGANDKRFNVPLGKNTDKRNTTFKGALNRMITDLKKAYPKAKILCMTNYDRFRSKNGRGYTDLSYVEAMKQVCKKRKIPCFDNYNDSGVSFHEKEWLSWCDEGVYLGKGKNGHFSPEGYRYLVPVYEKFIKDNAGKKKK